MGYVHGSFDFARRRRVLRPPGRPAAHRGDARGDADQRQLPRRRTVTGVEVTTLGKRIYNDELRLLDERDDAGRKRYEIYGWTPGYEEADGDRPLSAIAAGRIAVTPIHFDLTDHGGLERLRGWGLEEMLGPGPGGMSVAEDAATPRGGPGRRRRARRRAARRARPPQPPLLRPRRTRGRRRRLRRAAERAARPGARVPVPADPRLADAAGRRAAARTLRAGHPPRADALARQLPQRGGAARLGDAARQLPETARHHRLAVQLHDRAEDRRSRDHADLRGRGAGPRRDPRRRADRGGRDPEHQDDRLGAAAARRVEAADADRSARRGLPADRRLQSAERAARRKRGTDLRQPAQLGGGLDPPARPEAGRRTAALHLDLRDRRGRRDRPADPHGRGRVAAGAGLQGQPGHRPPPRCRGSREALPLVGGPARRRSTTRSTASSSRSTRRRSGASSGWSGASRAGRSPGSSRRPPR